MEQSYHPAKYWCPSGLRHQFSRRHYRPCQVDQTSIRLKSRLAQRLPTAQFRCQKALGRCRLTILVTQNINTTQPKEGRLQVPIILNFEFHPPCALSKPVAL